GQSHVPRPFRDLDAERAPHREGREHVLPRGGAHPPAVAGPWGGGAHSVPALRCRDAAAGQAAASAESTRCTSTTFSSVSTSRPVNAPCRSRNSIGAVLPCSITCLASSGVISRPFIDFQMTKPQPGFLRLFHDEQPYARLLPRMSPPQRGQVAIVSRTTRTADRTSGWPSTPTIWGRLPSPSTSLAGWGPSTSVASPCSSSARTSASPTVNPRCDFQIVKPQPGS